MENYKFDTYRSNKKGEIVIESKSEQSAINKIRSMNNVDLKENIDKEKIDESLNNEGVLVFYKGSLIRKI
jgi:hypothetical protein